MSVANVLVHTRCALGTVGCALLTVGATEATAHAQLAPTHSAPGLATDPAKLPQSLRGLSEYERETIEMLLAGTGQTIEPHPEGKIIESIEVRPLDVLEPRDPLPMFAIDFLNIFHVTSQDHTVERELLVTRGRPYSESLVLETARNLRNIRQFSLALAVPLKGSTPDRVRLLMITKDIWSLRLNSNFRFAGGELEELFIGPAEENVAGIHHTVSGAFLLEPDTYSLGGKYTIPRIAGSRVEGTVNANVIINRDTGDAEGSFGSFAYGQPLYSTRTKWGWAGSVGWRKEVTRRHIGIELAAFDAEVTPEPDNIPFVYNSDLVSGSFAVTRSFGIDIKNNFSLGMTASRTKFTPPDLSAFDPRAVDAFVDAAIPVSDTRIYPYLQYNTFTTDFLRVVDFNTLGLQEDYRLGHDFFLQLYPVSTALNSSRDYMGVQASMSYTFPLGDGLVRPYVESQTEVESERIADAYVAAGLRTVTPRMGIGRLVLDGFYRNRYRNYLNQSSQLGGDTRLRGYPSAAFRGANFVASNLEFRTVPLKLWTVYVGGTLFFDTGDAYDDNLDLKHSTGAGLRVLFPQLDRAVFRIDWGLPLQKEPELGIDGPLPGDVVVTFQQAFPMPSIPIGG